MAENIQPVAERREMDKKDLNTIKIDFIKHIKYQNYILNVWEGSDYFCFNQADEMKILNDQMKEVT